MKALTRQTRQRTNSNTSEGSARPKGALERPHRRRTIVCLSLALLVVAILFLALAGTALAANSAVYAKADNWFIYGYPFQYGGQSWEPWWGYWVDQDQNTAGTQITIANSKPIRYLIYSCPDYTGAYATNFDYAWSYNHSWTYIPVSMTPRLVTIQTQNCRYVYATGANQAERLADATRRYEAGYWVVTYDDYTTDIVHSGLPPTNGWLFGPGGPANYTPDPINTSIGNATYSFVDLSLPGKGLPLTFTRTYNSQDAGNSGFLGHGWRCEYQQTLEFPSSSQVTFVAADGRRDTFTSSGGGDYTSPSGVTERLHQNTNGSFTLTYLDRSHLEFSSAGQLSSLVDRYGNQTTLTYNSDGQPSTVTAASGRSLTFTYSYAYLSQIQDSSNRTVQFTVDVGGNLTSVTDPNGHVTQYAYDAPHQLTAITQPEGSAPLVTNSYTNGQATLQTDALGHETGLSFDPTNQQTTVVDARSHSSTDAWDANYRLTRHTDPDSNHYDLTYNSAGFPATFTDENGHQSSFVYDSLGNLTSATDPESHQTTASYDTTNGNPLWVEDALNHRTTFTWDQTGTFLDSMTSPTGTTSFTWNSDGTLDSLTDPRSHTWTYDHNTYGDLVSALDPLNYETTYQHDSAGRLTSVEDPNSSEVQFAYDTKGNVTAVKDPLAVTDPSHRHQLDATYDANDLVSGLTDARGDTTSFTRDDLNRLTLVQDALFGEAAFTYDANHNLSTLEDPNGHVTSYAYDNCDRISTITDPLSDVTGYSYDPAGNLTGISFPTGKSTSLTYTSNDLVSLITHDGDPTTWSFSYNANDATTEVEKNDGKTWAFTYDSGNRLTSASDENDPNLGSLQLGWTYDAVSNVTGITIGAQALLGLTYDARNLVATLTDAGGTTSFTHDDGGRLTKIATPDGSARSITYDPASRATELENTTDSGTQTFTYTYDANGDVLSEDSSTYTYDALDRLVGWYDPVGDVTTAYAYDAAGNLTNVQEDSVTTESHTYNAGNEITDTGFAYDENGNLTADGTYSYTYDADNQLVGVEQGETTIASMTYDYAGRRTSLTTSAGTTFFHYASGLLVAESDADGDITATYVYSPEGGLISMTRGGETYYYQTNAHGAVVSLTDSTGAVVNTYAYDPWGRVLSASETVTNPFRYAGYYYDSATGLYYLWHRYYDPQLRRFLTPDLVFGSMYDPAALNGYLYVFDNPVVLADSLGLSPSAGDIYNFFIGGPAAEAQRWVSWVGQYIPLTGNARDAASYYHGKAGTGSWLWKVPEWLANRWNPDNWAWTVTYLYTGWKYGVGTEGGTAAKAGVCPEASSAAPSSAGTMGHIFDNAKHNMDVLVQMFGSRDAAFNEVANVALAALRAQGKTGIFTIAVQVGGQIVTVTGRVMNGVARISNMWI